MDNTYYLIAYSMLYTTDHIVNNQLEHYSGYYMFFHLFQY